MRTTFSIKTSVGDYAANIGKEELFALVEKKMNGETVRIPLGKGTSYLEGNEYADDAALTLFPGTEILAIVEHNLEEKNAVSVTTK